MTLQPLTSPPLFPLTEEALMIKMCSGIRMTCWSVQHLLRYRLGTRWTLISPGTSCKSYADLFDGLALCVADFVDSRRPCIVIICSQKVKARYSLMYWPRFLAGSVVYVMIFLGNFIQSFCIFNILQSLCQVFLTQLLRLASGFSVPCFLQYMVYIKPPSA